MGETFDVAVVGSGPAGCSAAMLLGRKGLRVALLEAHRNLDYYKRLCTHSIRPSALPTIKRLGLDNLFEEHGAVRGHDSAWTKYGWVRETSTDGLSPHGYNISRKVMDPLVRATAAAVPGVELMLGTRLSDLTFDHDGRVNGIVANVDGSVRQIGAKLVVGADGYSSKVAKLASLPGKVSPNNRFVYFAEYRDVEVPAWCTTAIWFTEPDCAYVFCNEDGLTLLTVVPAKARLPEFRNDREVALLKMFVDLPDGPDLTAAQRVSDVVGTMDYPFITRKRIVAPGVALIGDAAMVGDPLWGTGCGWAFQTAEWLSDAIADVLLDGTTGSIDAGARRYQRRHKQRLLLHQLVNIDFAQKLKFNPLQRLLFAGAARDPKLAHQVLQAVTSRNRSLIALFSPPALARAALARRRPEPVASPV